MTMDTDKRDICERLSRHGQVDAHEIDLSVENGHALNLITSLEQEEQQDNTCCSHHAPYPSLKYAWPPWHEGS
jgi:hypothetical protein